MATLNVAIIGYGKIAEDQHVPAIRATPGLKLAAVVSARGAGPAGVPVFGTVAALLASGLAIDACAHCNTPTARFETALETIAAGKHILLEKPPAATLAQCAEIERAAAASGVSLMTTWHSQANMAVERAREWLSDKQLTSILVDWREDVRKWHPGQEWIWAPGGFGVFDPGINGLSILTRILPFAPYATASRLWVPANRAMPIAASLTMGGAGFRGAFDVQFDWRETAAERWQIAVESDAGTLLLAAGGRSLALNGDVVVAHGDHEYSSLYASFAALVAARQSYFHIAPLQIVADAFLLGTRETVPPFET
ncbi:MAG: Gfo/Idh/MocA family protein [Sphingomonas sp.]